MYWAAVATRSMSYLSIGEETFLLNYMASPPVVRPFRANARTIPVNPVQFTSSVLNIRLFPILYEPYQERSVNAPSFSIGEAISRQIFAYHPNFPFMARQFIAENPVLFVPGSYHTDMTGLGMPPLTHILAGDLLAFRARVANEAAAVRLQNGSPPPIRAPMPAADPYQLVLVAQEAGERLRATVDRMRGRFHFPVAASPIIQAPAAPLVVFRAVGEECPICMEPLHEEGSILMPCGHRHHALCLSRVDPQRCPDCRATHFPSRDALYDVMHSEVVLLRNQKNALSDELKETALERDSLREELVGEKEIHTLYDSEHAELLDAREKLKEASSAQTLKEQIKTISFAAGASLSSVLKCASDISSIACELVKVNNTLRVESRPGFLLRRVTDQRNGFAKLVESMGRVNGNMSRKIDALEIELKRIGE
jgi:hypothetical protein